MHAATRMCLKSDFQQTVQVQAILQVLATITGSTMHYLQLYSATFQCDLLTIVSFIFSFLLAFFLDNGG